MRLLVIGIAALLVATPAIAQTLNDTDVGAAIKAGESGKFSNLISDCVATAGFGENMAAAAGSGLNRTGTFSVVLSGNAGRIASMAARAKRLYKPLTVTAVTEEMRAPGIVVSVEPDEPSTSGNDISVPAVIEHVVLKSKSKSEIVVQPTRVETEAVTWSNLLGGSVQGNRAVAYFEQGAIRELPAGEFDMVVITANGERRCKVGNDDRKRLFP